MSYNVLLRPWKRAERGAPIQDVRGGIQILIKTGFEDLGIIKLFVRKLNDG